MEWIFYVAVVVCLIDIEEKLQIIMKKDSTTYKKETISFDQYRNKKVSIIVRDDDFFDSYLFSSLSNVTGKIIDFDDEWVIFQFYDKSKKMDRTIYKNRRY